MLTKIFFLVENKTRKQLLLLFLLINLIAALETFGISLIVPILSSLMQDPQNNFFFFKVFNYFKNFFGNEFISQNVFFILFFLLVFFIKSIFQTFLYFKKFSIINLINFELTDYFFSSYLSKNYSYFVKNNTSILINTIAREINSFSSNLIVSIINITVDLMLLIFLSSLLLVTDFYLSLIFILFSLMAIILYIKFIKNRVYDWGKIRFDTENSKVEILRNTFSAIKEIIFNNFQTVFRNHLSNAVIKNLNISKKQNLMNVLPKIWIEFLGLLLIFSYLFLKIISSETSNISQLIPTIGIFGFAAIKILPSLYRLINNFTTIRYNKKILDYLYNEKIKIIDSETQKQLSQKNKNKIEIKKFKNEIVLEKIDFTLDEKRILSNQNFNIKKNQMIAVVGKTGCGKTTLLDILAGINEPKTGTISIDDSVYKINEIKISSMISYMMQNFNIFNKSIFENITFQNLDKATPSEIKKVEELIDFCDFELEKNNKGKYFLEKKIGEMGFGLSGGEKQKIALARTLYREKDIIILDEPFSAMDNLTEKKILKKLKSLNKTLIVVTHNNNHLDFFDQIIYV